MEPEMLELLMWFGVRVAGLALAAAVLPMSCKAETRSAPAPKALRAYPPAEQCLRFIIAVPPFKYVHKRKDICCSLAAHTLTGTSASSRGASASLASLLCSGSTSLL